MATSAHVFWLFGLSGSGKSTLAEALADSLRRKGHPTLMLDGDVLRAGLCLGLGFSDAERRENLRRAAEVAKLGLASGLTVVASFITPLETHRRVVTEVIGRPQISLIHLDAPLAVCQRRDVKGLYSRADKGLVANMTGLTSGFERPTDLDLQIDTAAEPVETSTARLRDFARALLRANR
jgi:adenylyl-sulfate kinase